MLPRTASERLQQFQDADPGDGVELPKRKYRQGSTVDALIDILGPVVIGAHPCRIELHLRSHEDLLKGKSYRKCPQETISHPCQGFSKGTVVRSAPSLLHSPGPPGRWHPPFSNSAPLVWRN